jgi:hypothetical protein
MSVSPIGFLAIALGGLAFVRRPPWLFYAAIFFAPFSACAVVNLPSFGLSISLFFFLCFILAAVSGQVSRLELHLTRAQFLLLALLLLFYFACFSSLWTPLLGDRLISRNVSVITFIGVGVTLTVVVTLFVNNVERLFTTVKLQMAGAIFASVWGLMQFACSVLGLPYPSFIFNTSASHAADLFATEAIGGYVRVGSVAVEPSILVQSLAFPLAISATLLSCASPTLRRWCVATAIVSTGCIVLTTSTTGYIGLGMLAILLVGQQPSRTLTTLILGAPVAVALLVLMPGLVTAIVDNTFNKSQSWSYAHRTSTLFDGWQAFISHPLVGSGVGSRTVNSLPVYLLANVGTIGTLCFIVLVISAFLALRHICGPALRLPPAAQSVDSGRAAKLWPALPNAIAVSLAMQSVAGFSYAFPDFWIGIGLMIATVGVGARDFGRQGLDTVRSGRRRSRLTGHPAYPRGARSEPTSSHVGHGRANL